MPTRHKYIDGLNNQQITLCGGPKELWSAEAIPCEACEKEAKARAESRAERARRIAAAKEEKLRGMETTEIHD